MKKLSVALCTYNGADYLSAQLESILSQTLLPSELVIGDDCSTDSTAFIIKSFAARAPFPVRFHINDHNLGSTKNFESTILRCQGDAIVLCDQDDVWMPTKLSKLEAALNFDLDVGLVFSDAVLVDSALEPLNRRLWEMFFRPDEQDKFLQGQWLDVLLSRNVVTGATVAFRSEFRDLICPIPNFATIIHDGWIALVIGAFAKLTFIAEPLILYRQHPRQQLGVGLNRTEQVYPPRNIVIVKRDYKTAIDLLTLQMSDMIELFSILSELRSRARAHSLSTIATDIPWEVQRDKISAIQDLITHYQTRDNLLPNRFGRIGQVMRELFSRRYHRYSRGVISALKDILR